MTKGTHGNRNRLLSLAKIAVFDIAGPLVAYSMLRSAGLSQVSALILSGTFPAFGIVTGVIRHRRVDASTALAFRRQGEAQFGALADEELVRDLDEDAGAVAGFRIAAAGSAMGQVDEDLNALDDNVVRFLTLDIRDEADSAGVVLMARIVKSLRGR